MIIVALFAALAFYTVLFLFWESATTRLNSTSAILAALERMVLSPEPRIFALWRIGILILAIYVVWDTIRAGARKMAKKRKLREEEQAGLRIKTPPMQ